MKYFLPALLLTILSVSCMHLNKIKSEKHAEEMTYNNKVIAHRGAWKVAGLPENSVAALKAAIRMECFGSEMDVHLTDDEAIVVNHDPDYHGMRIQNSKLADLRKFNLSNGEPIPLLSDFLKVITSQKGTMLILEIKPSIRGKEWAMKTAAKVVEEVNRFKAGKQVIYISFDFDICREVLRLVPGAKIQYLNGDKTPQQIKDAGFSGLDYHYSVFQKHPVYFEEAKSLGLRTNAWTVNDSGVMDWLLSKGVDFITTNEPAFAFQRIEEFSSQNGNVDSTK